MHESHMAFLKTRGTDASKNSGCDSRKPFTAKDASMPCSDGSPNSTETTALSILPAFAFPAMKSLNACDCKEIHLPCAKASPQRLHTSTITPFGNSPALFFDRKQVRQRLPMNGPAVSPHSGQNLEVFDMQSVPWTAISQPEFQVKYGIQNNDICCYNARQKP